ncbi:MAG TPA: hypothetical protein VMV18_00170 [bacterium]|nr:hypothetical protein [bacterium]
MAAPFYEPGDVVVLRRLGLAKVTAREERQVGSATLLCYLLERDTGMVPIPVEKAPALLRAPMPVSEAQEVLGVLRAEGVEAGDLLARRHAAQTHQQGVADLEDPRAQATYLRRLYALPPPLTKWEQMAALHLEELVLDELAFVLGGSRDELTREMRGRYPALNAAAL